MANSRNKKRAPQVVPVERVNRPAAAEHLAPPPKTWWREWWLWYSGEYSWAMLEPWEIVLLHVIMLIFLVALFTAVRAFLPSHLRIISRRAKYYLYGDLSGLAPLDAAL